MSTQSWYRIEELVDGEVVAWMILFATWNVALAECRRLREQRPTSMFRIKKERA